MYEQLHCIALRTVRHSDRQSILTAWSRERGRVAIAMPADNGREARRRRALTMPLSLFEGMDASRPGREIVQLRELRPTAVAASLHQHPVKSTVAMFLAEVLDNVLRMAQPDTSLWDFLEGSVRALDTLQAPGAVANFHLWFLRALATLTGVAPDFGSWRHGSVFDMREGLFRITPPLHGRYLQADEALAVRLLGRLTPTNIARVHIPREARARMLDGILEYYALHGALSSASMRSLDVLRSLFV